MIVEKVLGQFEGKTSKYVDRVYVDWFEHNKHILKKISAGGVEIGMRLKEPLRDGDILYEDKNRVIIVEMNKTELIKISVSDIMEMGRLCFEIGNRHISLAIQPEHVKIPYDEPTYNYLKKLGFRVELVKEKFIGYKECRGHDHTHERHHHHG
ncbi:MAG: urease accessory protein UreE [Candidatus Ornithomonoglobus sp.]